MTTVLLAWAAVLAACTTAVLFGRAARTGPRRARVRARARVGVFISRSGPLFAVLGALAYGHATGDWMQGAVVAFAGVVVVAIAGLVLAPL